MFEIILFIAGFQVLFFLIFIAITMKLSSAFEKVIFAWLTSVFLFVATILLSQKTDGVIKQYFYNLSICFTLINGPFLYLTIKSYTNINLKLSIKHLAYFLQFIIVLILIIFINPSTMLSLTIQSGFNLINLIIFALFIFFSGTELRKYKKNLQNYISNVKKLNLKWVYCLFYGEVFFLIVFIGVAIVHLFIHPLDVDSGSHLDTFSPILLLFITFLGFFGINQNIAFNQNIVLDEKDFLSIKEEIENEKDLEKMNIYTNYGLKSEEAVNLVEQLTTYMENERPYKNMDLNLKDLSDALNTYPHYITQILNTVINKNFYDFVNSYRIDEIKKQLNNPESDKFTILAIAYECGFNSKTTFNRIFKQKTGVTPSEYKKKLTLKKNEMF